MKWKPSRRLQRLLLKLGAGLIALLVALAFGAEWLLRTDWFAEKLRARIQIEAERVLGEGVEIGDVDFDPAALRVELRDVASPAQERLDGAPLLRAPLIRLGLGWEAFLRGPLYLRSVVVESPELTLFSDDEGLHLPTLSEADGGLLAISIRRFDVRKARVNWNARQWDFSMQAKDIDALTQRPLSGCYETNLSGGRIAYQYKAQAGALDSVEARTSLCGQALSIQEARAVMAGAELLAQGSAELSDSPSLHLDYGLNGPLSAFAHLFPPEWMLTGDFEADGALDWDGAADTLAYAGAAQAHNLAVEANELRADQASISAHYEGGLERIRLSALEVEALGGVFRGEAEVTNLLQPSPRYRVECKAEAFRLQALLEAFEATSERMIWDAATTAAIQAEGRSLSDLVATAQVRLDAVTGSARAVSGNANLEFDGAAQRLRVEALDLHTDDTDMQASGTVAVGLSTAVEVALSATSPDDVLPLLELLGLKLDTAPFELRGPVAFDGQVRASRTATGVRIAVDGDVDTGRISLLGYEWRAAQGGLRIDPTGFAVTGAVLQDDRGRAMLDLQGNTPAAPGWKWADLPLHGILEVEGLDLAKTLAATGSEAPLQGAWSGRIELVGQLKDPRLAAVVSVTDAVIAGEKVDRVEVAAYVSLDRTAIEDLELSAGAGTVRGEGLYVPSERRFELDLTGRNWQLAEMERFRSAENPVSGQASFDVRASGKLAQAGDGFERLETSGAWRLADLAWRGADLGGWQGGISSSGDEVRLGWVGAPLGGEFDGEAVIDVPSGAFRGKGRLRELEPARLAELSDLPSKNVSGSVSGAFELSGDLEDPVNTFRAEGAFDDVELNVASIIGSELSYQLYNPFPMRWVFQNQRLEVEHMRLQGEGTDFEVDGDIGFGEESELALQLEGELNLAALGSLGGDITAEGRSTIEVKIEGDRNEPDVSGTLKVRGAALRSEDFSNGLTGVQGEVEFAGRQIRIRELSGISGGGRVSLSGFSQLRREGAEFRLRADVERVRLRYPAEVSSVVDGRLVLAGTADQALLSGELTVLRAATNPAVSLGTLIGSLKQPSELQPTNALLRNLQLNIQVVSAPDLNIETSVIRDIEADIDLRVVGGLGSPSLLGALTVSRGQINFHGSRYRINRGEISFVNPFRIEPVVDFEFETRIRDINIGLILSGPARRLNVSYRSDPPLSFADLVNLVAVGRSPVTDPVISSQQRIQQQSLFQTGANNVFNQAVESPVSPGLQRLFGVSRLKVDPQAGGAEANPAARISTEQQITDDVTLIYTYDLSSAQQQTFRLEYAPNRRWTFVLTRDQNGLVGSDVLYKTRLP